MRHTSLAWSWCRNFSDIEVSDSSLVYRRIARHLTGREEVGLLAAQLGTWSEIEPPGSAISCHKNLYKEIERKSSDTSYMDHFGLVLFNFSNLLTSDRPH